MLKSNKDDNDEALTNEIKLEPSTITATTQTASTTITTTNNTTDADNTSIKSPNTKALKNESSECVVKTEETWTDNSTYPFGPYPPKPEKGYEEHTLDPALFNDPSMKLNLAAKNTSVNYFGQPPVGVPREINYTMTPTPQEYATIALNGNFSVIQTANNNSMPNKQKTPSRQSSAPQDMMSTFNSRTVQSTPKRYKCEICQKRFTRPSSLQTHMYSHTGEKPFKCPVEECGRHFSVVSNLRRHQKIHSNKATSNPTPNVTDATPSTT
nr:1461_t:CDS:2 [Entrophospora candida]